MFGNLTRARRQWSQWRKLFRSTAGTAISLFIRFSRCRMFVRRVAGWLKICTQGISWWHVTGMTAKLGSGIRQHFTTAGFVNALQPVSLVQFVVRLQNMTAAVIVHRRHTEGTMCCTENTRQQTTATVPWKNSYYSTYCERVRKALHPLDIITGHFEDVTRYSSIKWTEFSIPVNR